MENVFNIILSKFVEKIRKNCRKKFVKKIRQKKFVKKIRRKKYLEKNLSKKIRRKKNRWKNSLKKFFEKIRKKKLRKYFFFEKELYFILSEICNIYLWNTLLFCITKTVLGPTQNQNCCLQQPFVIYYVNDAPNHLAQILKRLKTIAIYRWTSLPIITLWVTQLRQICRL